MKLADYLDRNNVTVEALGDAVGVSHTYISKLARGLQKPSFEVASKIAAATNGAVMPNDFMDDLPGIIAGFPDPDEHRRAG